MAPNSDLFRNEALRALHEPLRGRPILFVPRSWHWLLCLLLGLFAAALILAPFITFHRTETVRGWLVPDRGATILVAPRPATVGEMVVGRGDTVSAGDILVVLEGDQYSGNGGSRLSDQASSLTAEILEIRHRRDAIVETHRLDVEALKQQLTDLDDELRSVLEQIEARKSQVRIAAEKHARLVAAGDAISEWRAIEQKDELTSRKVMLQSLRQQAASTRR